MEQHSRAYGREYGAKNKNTPEALALVETCCVMADCEEQLSPRFPSVPLCERHAALVVRDYNRIASTVEVGPPPVRCPTYPSPPQVYYLGIAPDVVKIGYTVNLATRVRSIRRTLADVLATEPGGKDVEQKRHRQFAADRIGVWAEDFTLSAELAEHIQRMRRTHDTIVTAKGMAPERWTTVPRLA